MRTIWVLTLAPGMYRPLLEYGVVGQALRGERQAGVQLKTVWLADFSPKGFKGVDDTPYGGGQGMVLRADVLKKALLEGVVGQGGYGENWRERLLVACPSPRGCVWNSGQARRLAASLQNGRDLALVCGRYEGIDERFIAAFVEAEFSLGDFVLSCGDIAAWAMIDSAVRLLPGVLGNPASAAEESFDERGRLEHPHYTRPADFDGRPVPQELLSGNHQNIRHWRRREGERVTKTWRPDLR